MCTHGLANIIFYLSICFGKYVGFSLDFLPSLMKRQQTAYNVKYQKYMVCGQNGWFRGKGVN